VYNVLALVILIIDLRKMIYELCGERRYRIIMNNILLLVSLEKSNQTVSKGLDM